jgi:hypothetical protein
MATTPSRCYIVIFQIASLERRKALRESLKTYPGYCPLGTGAWAIITPKKATEVRDELSDHLAKGDRLYVLKSGGAGAWQNAISDRHSDWLKKNL